MKPWFKPRFFKRFVGGLSTLLVSAWMIMLSVTPVAAQGQCGSGSLIIQDSGGQTAWVQLQVSADQIGGQDGDRVVISVESDIYSGLGQGLFKTLSGSINGGSVAATVMSASTLEQYYSTLGLTDRSAPEFTSHTNYVDVEVINERTNESCLTRVTFHPSDVRLDPDRGQPAPVDNNDEQGDPLADFRFCEQVPGDIDDPSTQRGKCAQCVGREGEDEDVVKLFTAVGCLRIDERGLVADLVKLLLGVAGGVALLTILASAFLIATSQGDPSRVKQARELMTAAVAGIFFMIFSVITLQFVGVEILQIPGLAGGSSGGGNNGGGGTPPVATAAPTPANLVVGIGTNIEPDNLQACVELSTAPQAFDGSAVNVVVTCTQGAACSGFPNALQSGLTQGSGTQRCSAPINVASLALTQLRTQLQSALGNQYGDQYELYVGQTTGGSPSYVYIYYRPTGTNIESYLSNVKPVLDEWYNQQRGVLQFQVDIDGQIVVDGVAQSVDTGDFIYSSLLPAN